MQSDVSIKRLKQFPRLMWILLFGSFITRGSYYMVWPFLAVILYEKFALSATEIGLILTNAAIISVLVSFVGSLLSDRIGRKKLMYLSGVLYIISFSLLAEVTTVTGYVVVMTLCSIATALWRPLVSALIGDIIDETETRELAMQSLYFAVNVGCAIGPMVGVWMGLTGEQSSFYLTAGAFAFLLVLLCWGFNHHQKLALDNEQARLDKEQALLSNTSNDVNDKDGEQASPKTSFHQTMRVLMHDKLLQVLIIANILCMFIYAQMDSSLIQYLTRAEVPKLIELISSMIFANALVIISTQFLLLKLMANMTLIKRIQLSLILLMVSQVWLALNPLDWFWGFISAIIVMSLAEAILFPTMNVHIDRLAPQNLRGAYFGAASFYEIGYAFAPLGGGIILDLFGGFWLFMVAAAMALIVFYLYANLEKMPRPDFDNLKI
ncbi:MFS transporter [Thalassotalea crassostreae]|uniref:MFS transporter n=1 Tax=Thalassotalea crassostreae TaxID=1763536 RepID=UPI000838D506|nr:MFS transporter [Thalassotalea crassostreae]